MWILDKIFHVTAVSEEAAMDAAAAAEDAITTSTKNTAAATSNIGVAATGAAASQAPIPIVGPELAIAAAAAMVVSLAPFEAMAAFEKGGIVPETGMGMLHGGEMVLPKELSTGMQDMVARGGPRGSDGEPGRDGERGGYEPHFHYHAGDVHALDADGVDEVLMKNKNGVGKVVGRLFETGQLNLRDYVRR